MAHKLFLALLIVLPLLNPAQAGQESHGGNTLALRFAYSGRLVSDWLENHPRYRKQFDVQEFAPLVDQTLVFVQAMDNASVTVQNRYILISEQWTAHSQFDREQDAMTMYLKAADRADAETIGENFRDLLGKNSSAQNHLSQTRYFTPSDDLATEFKSAVKVLIALKAEHPHWPSFQLASLNDRANSSVGNLDYVLKKASDGSVIIRSPNGRDEAAVEYWGSDGLNVGNYDYHFDGNRAARTSAKPKEILVVADAWKDLSQAEKLAFTLHECAGLVDHMDANYQISSRMLLDLTR